MVKRKAVDPEGVGPFSTLSGSLNSWIYPWALPTAINFHTFGVNFGVRETVNLAKSLLMLFLTLGFLQPPGSLSAPAAPSTQKTRNNDSSNYDPPSQLAVLKDKAVKESSGLAASRTVPGIYWTHNDSGDSPLIYAFDSRGNSKGTWRVTGATAQDWEDIAAGPGPTRGTNYLYIGDIGDNRERRAEIVVYRVPEPGIQQGKSTPGKAAQTAQSEAIRLRYPDGSHDAETLLVHPSTGNIYIVTKIPFANPAIYEAKAPLTTQRTIELTRVGTLEVPSLLGGIITGGAISPDGRRVAFCDYIQGYEVVLESGNATFNSIWTRSLTLVNLGKRSQGEAITYRLDGKALLMTSEGSPMPLLQVVRR